MPILTIIFGLLLIVTGVVGYLPHHAPTALIPAYVGGLLIVCALVAFDAALRKHAMHAAVMVGLLGFLAAAGKFLVGMARQNFTSPLSFWCQFAMVGLCGIS